MTARVASASALPNVLPLKAKPADTRRASCGCGAACVRTHGLASGGCASRRFSRMKCRNNGHCLRVQSRLAGEEGLSRLAGEEGLGTPACDHASPLQAATPGGGRACRKVGARSSGCGGMRASLPGSKHCQRWEGVSIAEWRHCRGARWQDSAPALLTRMSSLPNSLDSQPAKAETLASSVMSRG